MWVARDKDNSLWLFKFMPYKQNDIWECVDIEDNLSVEYQMEIDKDLFPDLKWEDDPKEVYFNTGYDMANQINHVWAMLKCTQDELNKANQTVQYYRTKFEALEKIINNI